MMPHPAFTLLTACLLSIAMAATEKRTPLGRMYAAARMLVFCAIATVGGGWLMRFIHG